MAFTLISIITLAGIAIAVPVPQNTGVTACKSTYWSQAGDTCRSIGLPWGYYDTDILAANSFLNCDDIWVNTPICIPDIPTPVTVTYPNPGPSSSIGATIPTPTPVCQQSIISVAGENCDSIGSRFGVTGADILAANSFLDCANIWTGTPICIPAVFYEPTTTTIIVEPVPSCASTYIASSTGETCESIGSKFGVSAANIKNYNDFLNCEDIWQWTSICIPYPVISDVFPTATISSSIGPLPTCIGTHISAAGDTCDSIAAQYHLTSADVFNANTFLDCNNIWVGTPICINHSIISDSFPTVTISSSIGPLPTCIGTHISAAGDTCDSIAAQYHLTSADVFNANTFLDCNNIWVGTPICINHSIISTSFSTATISSSGGAPLPTHIGTYISVAGDTCDSIAAQYGVTSADVFKANTFLDCNNIWVGTPVNITHYFVADPPMTYDPNTELNNTADDVVTYTEATPALPTES